ncbi:Hypothetical predicted protein [Marmota monax]|uniref:Uncharacterized protein n=1 Tax=Marmota monax TaxID=9995 RepID=A0A5E4B152_MARMO|nr:hypothetical protein GHT09_001506 [Marmota monax]VTJ62771.1 Hypothetical predicted protein [Marmota monax]
MSLPQAPNFGCFHEPRELGATFDGQTQPQPAQQGVWEHQQLLICRRKKEAHKSKYQKSAVIPIPLNSPVSPITVKAGTWLSLLTLGASRAELSSSNPDSCSQAKPNATDRCLGSLEQGRPLKDFHGMDKRAPLSLGQEEA